MLLPPVQPSVSLTVEVFEMCVLVWWNLNCLEINIALIAGGAKIQLKTSVVLENQHALWVPDDGELDMEPHPQETMQCM